ncbi:MAG: dienelactone hydrolase family protein [Gammaproteobacteria bacterium]|nr:dienelactone hydrolase family protein [Gammaproteobacteria bacterium]
MAPILDNPLPDQSQTTNIAVQAGRTDLEGILAIPHGSKAIVLFAHGSGSSRFSSRNHFVARKLNDAGLATLLFDLLTAEEHKIDQVTRELRFDIALLSERLVSAVDWVNGYKPTRRFKIGLFGASTGAAAALIAAAEKPDQVEAVVSRGGRPDLAGDALPRVCAPTLLIVGGHDDVVIQLNQEASRLLNVAHSMEIVPGATHLFEEPGKLERVSQLACDWFRRYLVESHKTTKFDVTATNEY